MIQEKVWFRVKFRIMYLNLNNMSSAKQIFLLLFFIFPINIYSQSICLDTIQKLRNKKIFSIKVEKIKNDEFFLLLKNVGTEEIYFADFQIEDKKLLNPNLETIIIGESALLLEDYNYFNLLKIMPDEEIKIKYTSITGLLSSMKITIEISFIFKNAYIKSDKNKIFINKKFFYKRIKKFIFNPQLS